MEFEDGHPFKNGCLSVDFRNRTCRRADGEVKHLTPLETTILSILNPEETTRRSDLWAAVSRRGGIISQHELTNYISSIRGKLGRKVIQGRRDFGYRLLTEEEFLGENK